MSTLQASLPAKEKKSSRQGRILFILSILPGLVPPILIIMFFYIMIVEVHYESKIYEQLQIIETQRISSPIETIEAFSMPLIQGKIAEFPALEPSAQLPTVSEIMSTIGK